MNLYIINSAHRIIYNHSDDKRYFHQLHRQTRHQIHTIAYHILPALWPHNVRYFGNDIKSRI